MKRLVLLALLPLLLHVLAIPANACSLCLGGMVFTPGVQLDVADRAVIAVPLVHRTRWDVLGVEKASAVPAEISADPVDEADETTGRPARPVLLLHHDQGPRWANVGPIGVEYADWLRQLVAAGPMVDRPDVDWPGRV